jgi:hypothetical protein
MDGMSRSDRAVFRLPAAALFVPVIALFIIIPMATLGGAWALLFVVPVAALVWVAVTRTVATRERVTAYGLRAPRRMAWADLDRLEFTDSRWAVAVGNDGRRLRLPMVRPRDLPELVAASGGSLELGTPDAPEPSTSGPADSDEPTTSTSDSGSIAESDTPDDIGPAQPAGEQAPAPIVGLDGRRR